MWHHTTSQCVSMRASCVAPSALRLSPRRTRRLSQLGCARSTSRRAVMWLLRSHPYAPRALRRADVGVGQPPPLPPRRPRRACTPRAKHDSHGADGDVVGHLGWHFGGRDWADFGYEDGCYAMPEPYATVSSCDRVVSPNALVGGIGRCARGSVAAPSPNLAPRIRALGRPRSRAVLRRGN